MEKIEEVEIYPRDLKIYGWENPRSLENVISIIRGLIDGDKIPSFTLNTFNFGKSFEIAYCKNGGHHRIIAGNLLDCRLETIIKSFEKKKKGIVGIPSQVTLYNIKHIELISKPSYFYEEGYKKPLPSVEEFFTKYKEINKALKHCPKNYSFTRREYKDFLESLKQWQELRKLMIPF